MKGTVVLHRPVLRYAFPVRRAPKHASGTVRETASRIGPWSRREHHDAIETRSSDGGTNRLRIRQRSYATASTTTVASSSNGSLQDWITAAWIARAVAAAVGFWTCSSARWMPSTPKRPPS